MPHQARTDTEIKKCFEVMSELRTHLKKDEFLQLVRQMETEGFRLAYLEDKGTIVAVAGYRIFTNLFSGKNLYVDDLVTSEKERSNGHGETMIAWLRGVAKAHGCNFYHLDSGTQRHEAHKFYFRQGFKIDSYHFGEQLENT